VAKAIVGSNIFHHESGIHTDGILKSPALYEAFSPEEVGAERKIIIGKHCGTAAILHTLRQLGLTVDPEFAACLLPRIRAKAVQAKRPLLTDELQELAVKWLPQYKAT
jgi:homocitrate synthase NifV